MTSLSTRPRTLDIEVYTDDDTPIRFRWPTSLGARTFTVDVDGTTVNADVSGTDVLVTFPAELNAAGARPPWKFVETTAADRTRFTGRLLPGRSGSDSQDDTIVVTEDDVIVEITVLGEPGATGVVAATGLATYDPDTQTIDVDPADIAINGSQVTAGTIPDARIPSTITRDTELVAAIDALKNGAPAGGDTLSELDTRLAVVEALGSLATDAELVAAVIALIGAADAGGDTLGELQALINLRLLKSANLSDLANVGTALDNLGFSTLGKTLRSVADAAAARTAIGVDLAGLQSLLNGTYMPLKRGLRAPNSIVLLGDSITAHNLFVTGVNTYTSSAGFFAWLQQELRQPFDVLNYAGISGNTLTQMIARIQADVIAYNPGWCFIFGGINDIFSRTAAQIEADLTTIYDTLDAAGIRVIGATLLPYDSATNAQKNLIAQVNEWLRRQARYRPNFVLVDWHQKVADPSTSTDVWASGLSTDGIHPATAGARRMGRTAATVLRPLVPVAETLVGSQMDAAVINANPMLAGTGGTAGSGVTGAIASSWTIGPVGTAGTAVASKVSRANDPDPSPGDWQQIAVSAPGSLGYGLFQVITAQTLWAPSDGFLYYCELEFQTDLFPSAPTQFRLAMVQQNAGFVNQGTAYDLNTEPDTGGISVYPLENQLASGVMRTPAIAIAAGTTRLIPRLEINGTGVTIRVGRFSLRRKLAATDA